MAASRALASSRHPLDSSRVRPSGRISQLPPGPPRKSSFRIGCASEDGAPGDRQPDQCAPQRRAHEEGARAVDRIDVPAVFGFHIGVAELLGYDAMVGICRADRLAQHLLDRVIGARHGIESLRILVVDGEMAAEVGLGDAARRMSQLEREALELDQTFVTLVHGGRLCRRHRKKVSEKSVRHNKMQGTLKCSKVRGCYLAPMGRRGRMRGIGMKTGRMRGLAAALLCLGLASSQLAAQDIAITNARVIVGNGTLLDAGTIIVRDGRIVEVTDRAADTRGLTTIDASGLTAMPGFIDAHRHINTGPNEREEMQAQLEAGYTTILSGGGPAEGNLVLRERIESGEINGPRIIPSGRIRLAGNTPEAARAEVRELAAMGIEFTGEIALTPEPRPGVEELAVLEAIVDEAARAGVTVQVHAVSTPAMVAAVEAGVRRLVHLPNKDFVDHDAARLLAATDTMILATIGFGAPIFGVFADDNEPRFRDGNAWPEAIAGANRDGQDRAEGTEIGYTIVNARTVFDAGALLGYCTDTRYDPWEGLKHELESFNVMFSMRDIVEIMGPNTAAYINMADELGTLEAGKLADIVLVAGNPMDGFWNMLDARVVLKEGAVVVDKR